MAPLVRLQPLVEQVPDRRVTAPSMIGEGLLVDRLGRFVFQFECDRFESDSIRALRGSRPDVV